MNDNPPKGPAMPEYDRIIETEFANALKDIEALVKKKRRLLGLGKMDLSTTELENILEECEKKAKVAISNAEEKMRKAHISYIHGMDDYKEELNAYISSSDKKINIIDAKQKKAISDFNFIRIFYDSFQNLVKSKNEIIVKIQNKFLGTSDREEEADSDE